MGVAVCAWPWLKSCRVDPQVVWRHGLSSPKAVSASGLIPWIYLLWAAFPSPWTGLYGASGPSQGGFNRFAFGVAPVACRKGTQALPLLSVPQLVWVTGTPCGHLYSVSSPVFFPWSPLAVFPISFSFSWFFRWNVLQNSHSPVQCWEQADGTSLECSHLNCPPHKRLNFLTLFFVMQ